jgi:hypothetical protein
VCIHLYHSETLRYIIQLDEKVKCLYCGTDF